MSNIAKVPAEAGVPYVAPISILSSLGTRNWKPKRRKPDWIKIKYHVRVHKYDLVNGSGNVWWKEPQMR